MKLNSLLKTLAVILLLSGICSCSTTKPSDNAMAGGGMSAAFGGAHARGLGEHAGFGDRGGTGAAFSEQANRLKAPYDQVYRFDFDKYEVRSEDVSSIEAQANYLAAHANAKVRLEGNADERGSREYNIALGWKRAKAVATILEQQGVAPSQIAMVSYGKEKPVAFGHDEASYSLNRRANLVYESKD